MDVPAGALEDDGYVCCCWDLDGRIPILCRLGIYLVASDASEGLPTATVVTLGIVGGIFHDVG